MSRYKKFCQSTKQVLAKKKFVYQCQLWIVSLSETGVEISLFWTVKVYVNGRNKKS